MAATTWEKTDVAAKIFLGFSGLVLSIVLALGQKAEHDADVMRRDAQAKTDTERKDADALMAREQNLTAQYQYFYGTARAAKSDDGRTGSDLDLAGAIAQQLAAKPFERPYYTQGVLALRATLTSVKPSTGSNGSLKFQSGEASVAAPAKPDANAWFAVIGTYPVSADGLSQAGAQARGASAALGCVEVWKTKVSNNYAVVAGTRTDQSTALAQSARARQLGVASDAFTQADREWTRVTGC